MTFFVMNTITSGGTEETGVKHRIIWRILLTVVIDTWLLAFGGSLDAAIIAALPFTFITVLMMVTLAKATHRDGLRDKA